MTIGLTITGTQILQGAGILSSITIMTSINGESGGYTVKKFQTIIILYMLISLEMILLIKHNDIKIGLDGNPLSGQEKLSPSSRKKLLKLILKAL